MTIFLVASSIQGVKYGKEGCECDSIEILLLLMLLLCTFFPLSTQPTAYTHSTAQQSTEWKGKFLRVNLLLNFLCAITTMQHRMLPTFYFVVVTLQHNETCNDKNFFHLAELHPCYILRRGDWTTRFVCLLQKVISMSGIYTNGWIYNQLVLISWANIYRELKKKTRTLIWSWDI